MAHTKRKTAVVYDKWLKSLGGAEVVALHTARALKDNGYNVTIVSGKEITYDQILDKLDIDVSDIPIQIIWIDEIRMKQLARNADVFINVSFMDYMYGYAKKNLYYTHFPTPAHDNIKGRIFNNIILPFAGHMFKPYEFIEGDNDITINGRYGSLADPSTKVAFYKLKPHKIYTLKFALYVENFYFTLIKDIDVSIQGGIIHKKKIHTDPHHNILHFAYDIETESETITVQVTKPEHSQKYHTKQDDRIFMIIPRIFEAVIPYRYFLAFYEKGRNRLRAGVFINILKRLSSYQTIFANSEYTKKWIKRYWHKESDVLYPPVDLVFKNNKIPTHRKKQICSVGRFFTKGHGKRQEVLIEAFKKLYDKGHADYELHLIGGVGTEPSSAEFVKTLKTAAEGYPIHFHFNAPRQELIKILTESQFFWMATGYQLKEEDNPILFEHFGISAIEALSAGCTTFVYNAGGLRETVSQLDNQYGDTFDTIDELVDKTIDCITSDTQVELSSLFTMLDSKYSLQAFKKKLLTYVNG